MAGGKGNIRPEDGKQFSKENQPDEKWTESEALKLINEVIEWQKSEPENIYISWFIAMICDQKKYKGEIYPELFTYLSNKFTSFFNRYKLCKYVEEAKLKQLATFGEINPGFTKFLLETQFGYITTTKIDATANINTTEADLSKLSTEEILKRVEALQKLEQ